MIPAIYKRARSNSALSTSSGVSSFHRKTRSVSYGVAKSKEHESTPVRNKTTEQNLSLTDSGIAEVPMKRVCFKVFHFDILRVS